MSRVESSREETLLNEFRRKDTTVPVDAVEEMLWYLSNASDQIIPSHCASYDRRVCRQRKNGNPDCINCYPRKLDIAKLELLIACRFAHVKADKEDELLGSVRFEGDGMALNAVRRKITTSAGDVYVAHAYVPFSSKIEPEVNCTIVVDSRYDDTLSLSESEFHSEDQINRQQWHRISQNLRKQPRVNLNSGMTVHHEYPDDPTKETLNNLREQKSVPIKPDREVRHRLLRSIIKK